MAYTKTNWQTGDVIDATKLNHAEDGIAQAQQTADAANARDSLADLTDVEITGTPTDGQVILYDATNSKWVNGSAGGGVEYINVFDATNNKLNKTCEEMLELSTQAILYCDFINNWSFNSHTVYQGKYNLTSIYKNGISCYFVFQRIVFEGYLNDSGKPTLKGIFPSSLEISDLPHTKSNDGQMLQYDRMHSSWKAVNPTMSILTDVSISSPATGQVLKYNGSKWVNGSAPSSQPYRYLVYGHNDDYEKNMLQVYTNTSGTSYVGSMDGIVNEIRTAGCTLVHIDSTNEDYAITSITQDQDTNYIIHTTSQNYTFVRDTDNYIFVLQTT